VRFLDSLYTTSERLVDARSGRRSRQAGDFVHGGQWRAAARDDHMEELACLALTWPMAVAGLRIRRGARLPIRIGLAAGPVSPESSARESSSTTCLGGDAVNARRDGNQRCRGRIQDAPRRLLRLKKPAFVLRSAARSSEGQGASCNWYVVGRRDATPFERPSNLAGQQLKQWQAVTSAGRPP